MSEERKDVNAELTDEAVEQATGGYNIQRPVSCTVSCPECQFVYTFVSEQTVKLPPDCPNCGYKWVVKVQQTAF